LAPCADAKRNVAPPCRRVAAGQAFVTPGARHPEPVDVILLAIAPVDACAEAEAPGGYPSGHPSNREAGRRRRQRRLGTFRHWPRRCGIRCCLAGLYLSTPAFEETEGRADDGADSAGHAGRIRDSGPATERSVEERAAGVQVVLLMRRRMLRVRGGQQVPEAWAAPEPFGISEQVLLCCFGHDQSTERSGADLRKALVEVGFRGAAAREIVRHSSLTRRSAPGSYRLRRLGEERSVP
jgi:hypothetical protein